MPSYIEMCNLAMQDNNVRTAYEQQKLEKARAEFGENDTTVNGPESIETDNISWRQQKLKRAGSTGVLEKSIYNALTVLENDTELKDKVVFDRFSNRFLIKAKLPWREK